jgi:hypothetical protein
MPISPILGHASPNPFFPRSLATSSMKRIQEKRPIKYGQPNNIGKGKKSKKTQIITFDEDSRKEFLTGFHRRKQQRRKFAEKVKKDQEREQKCENRRLKREYRNEILRSLDNATKELKQEQQDQEEEEEETIQVGSSKVTISRLDLE